MRLTSVDLPTFGRPTIATVGSFAAASGLIQLESVIKAIRSRFTGKIAEGNIAAATEAFNTARAAIAKATGESE